MTGARLGWFLVFGGLLLVPVALGFWFRPAGPEAPKEIDGAEDFDQLLVTANPGYVGIETCAECHTNRAAEFRTGRHYLACRSATGVAAPGFTPDRSSVSTRIPGLHFEMTRSGNDFFETRVLATAQGQQRSSDQIGLVYGSVGKHDEIYFAWQDDRLYELPVAWLYPVDRWGSHNNNYPRETPAACVECHNTWISHVPGTVNQYRRDSMLLGVTCERCHGSGKEHVEHHRTHPKEPAHAILHPGTLSRERLMDVCAQCHANPRPLGRAFSYRPGEPLEAHYREAKPTYPEDDVTNQVRYLSESKCFQKSQMTCITCHDPHRPRSAQGSCLTCHTAASCTDQPHLPAAVRGDCVGCHMPQRIRMHAHFYTTADDQYLSVTPRSDHHIGVYPEARGSVLLTWLRKQPDAQSRTEADRLTAQLTQHWINEGDKLVRDRRFMAAIGAFREALQIAPDPTARQKLQDVIARQSELEDSILTAGNVLRQRPNEAIRLYTKILEIRPDLSFVHGELGSLYVAAGRRAEAITHWQAVAKYDPSDAFGVFRLAEMAYFTGRTEEAAALCAKANGIDPANPMNHHLWGQVLLKQERWADAEQQFRKLLLLDPAHVGGNGGLSESLRHQGQAAEAIRFARRAVHWSKEQNAEALLTLGDAYIAANRNEDAHKTLRQALEVAELTNHPVGSTIRDRLRALP